MSTSDFTTLVDALLAEDTQPPERARVAFRVADILIREILPARIEEARWEDLRCLPSEFRALAPIVDAVTARLAADAAEAAAAKILGTSRSLEGLEQLAHHCKYIALFAAIDADRARRHFESRLNNRHGEKTTYAHDPSVYIWP